MRVLSCHLRRCSSPLISCLLLSSPLPPTNPTQVIKPPAAPAQQQAAAEAEALQAMEKLTVAPLDSRQGGVHDVGGSQVRQWGRGADATGLVG